MLTSHSQQILEQFVPALYRGLSITNLVSVWIETVHNFLGLLFFSHDSFCSTFVWTWLVIFVKLAEYKELPSWNDHYNETLYLALKPAVWVSGCPKVVAFPYVTPLHLEAMELAGHSSKHIFQPAKKISGLVQWR